LSAEIAETIAKISLLTEQTKQDIAKDDLIAADASLLERQQLIEHLVALESPVLSANTKSFLEKLLQDDDVQVIHLEQLKSAVKSKQSNTKHNAKSINRYLDIKQF